MAFIPALNTAQAVIAYISANGEEAKNVLHFQRSTGPITEVQMDGLRDLLFAWLDTYWAGAASAQWQTDLITLRDMTVQDGMIKQYVVTVNGLDGGPAMNAATTVAMSFRTGLAGPSRRGRAYHVGLRKDGVVGSTLTSAESTALINAWSGLPVELDGSGWTWVVASYRSGGAPRATALLTPITNVILTDPIVDSMDSRKPRDLE